MGVGVHGQPAAAFRLAPSLVNATVPAIGFGRGRLAVLQRCTGSAADAAHGQQNDSRHLETGMAGLTTSTANQQNI